MVTWRARQHRNPQTVRQNRPHQRIETDPGVHVNDPAVGIYVVNAVHGGHVDHQTAAILGRVTVAAPQPSRDHPARASRLNSGSDGLDIRCRQHLRPGLGTATPPTEQTTHRRLTFAFSHGL